MSTPGSSPWRTLLARGITCLDSVSELGLPAPEWTFGGGTVLMLRYEHRISRDVGLFLHDAQYLIALSPRINAVSASLTDSYDESSSSLKLAFEEGELDFIIAPSLLGLDPEELAFRGRTVLLDATAEILAKKLFYRAASLKVRDLFDLGVAMLREPGLQRLVRSVLAGKAKQLQRRVAALAPRFSERLASEVIQVPGGAPAAEEVLSAAERFVRSLMTGRE